MPSQKWNTSCVCQGEGVIYTVFSDLVLKIHESCCKLQSHQAICLPPGIFGHFLVTSSIPQHQQASSLTQVFIVIKVGHSIGYHR